MAPRLLHYSDLEWALDDPDRVARLAGLLDAARDDDALVLGSGDDTAPGVLATATEGRAALDFFDAVAPDAETPGNHDFDFGLEATRQVVHESPQQWVSANVSADGGWLAARDVVPAETFEVDGARVGVTGVTDPRTADAAPAATGLEIADPVRAVGEAVAGVRADVDHLVVLSHTGRDDDIASAHHLDAVLGGHVHDERIEHVAGTVCTRPGANGDVVLEVDLGTGAVTRHAVADAPADPAVRERFERRRAAAGLDEVVTRTEVPVGRDPTDRLDGESRAGNFVTDAYRWAAGADCALHNAGGLRAGAPLAGDVRVSDLVSLVPFDEPVVLAEVEGRELSALLEEAYADCHGEYRWTAHVSGMRVRYDTGARELREVSVGGRPVAPGRRYRLATSAYLLQTPHEFPTLEEGHRVRTLDTQYEVLAAYAREQGLAPERDGRVVLE